MTAPHLGEDRIRLTGRLIHPRGEGNGWPAVFSTGHPWLVDGGMWCRFHAALEEPALPQDLVAVHVDDSGRAPREAIGVAFASPLEQDTGKGLVIAMDHHEHGALDLAGPAILDLSPV
jgi:hypothetical protein